MKWRARQNAFAQRFVAEKAGDRRPECRSPDRCRLHFERAIAEAAAKQERANIIAQ